jgi:hypothetical protein
MAESAKCLGIFVFSPLLKIEEKQIAKPVKKSKCVLQNAGILMVLLIYYLARLFDCIRAKSGMPKTKAPRRLALQPLEAGQIWEVAGMNLQVNLVGKLLVHYKLAKPGAVRIPNLVNGRATIEKYLKKNKAILIKAEASKD